ncbi:MAG: O-antigen ligase family protein [Aeromonas sp.]
MHVKNLKKKSEYICLMIFIFSFFSINGLGLNPSYLIIIFSIFLSFLMVMTKRSLTRVSLMFVFFAFSILVMQVLAFKNIHTPALMIRKVNYLSSVIFILSILYAVPFYEFFRLQSRSARMNIYRLAGYIFIIYLFIEWLVRLAIGNPSRGLLYGFKKSMFYFDSNFTGLVILSFVVFYLFLINIGSRGFGLILGLLLFILLFTMSRAAMGAAFICAAIFYSHHGYRWRATVSLITYLSFFSLLCYLYLFEIMDFVKYDGSFNSKFYIVRRAMELIEELPTIPRLFGVGFGNFNTYTGIFAHNIFVTVVIEMGFVGCISFLLFMVYSIIVSKGAALYIWLPTWICGISLFGVYSPFLFLVNAAIILESKLQNCEFDYA